MLLYLITILSFEKTVRSFRQMIGAETIYITYLAIEPAYRRNGAERYNGWFPKNYSKPSYAKAAVTKKLGREWRWEND